MQILTGRFCQSLMVVMSLGWLCVSQPCQAGGAASSSGAATLIRPELSNVSFTNVDIQTVAISNISLLAVGQIPVLATNIAYQLIFTNNGPVNIYYDTLVLTNSPIVTGGPYVCTDLMITNVTSYLTNVVTSIVPVGQIPVIATNITYQLIITNPANFTLLYNSLVITYTSQTPDPSYQCTDLLVTNMDGAVTNVVVIGAQCTSTNSQTILTLVTNSVPNIEYYTQITTNAFFDPNNPLCWQTVYLTNTTTMTVSDTNLVTVGTTCVLSNNLTTISIVTNNISASLGYTILATTNLVFDPNNPLCWQTVYQTNLTVTTTVNTNVTTTDVSFTFAGSATARGTVMLQTRGAEESFSVLGRDLLTDSSSPPIAMGVFIGNSIFDPNWINAGIMSKAGTNNLYRLDLSSPNGAPPTLGVAHISSLAGMLLQIRDQASNVYAQAVIPALVPSPSQLSYIRKISLQRPNPAPSPKATGTIRVKYNGRTGASFLDVSIRNLAPGNSYCVLYTNDPSPDTSGCDGSFTLVNGHGFDLYDTSKGQDLPLGIGTYVSTVADLAGLHVYIIDGFGNIHLFGVIPGR